MQAYTYIEKGKFALIEKQKPTLIDSTDAIVKVTLGSICTSDLHIKHGSVPRAVPGITVGQKKPTCKKCPIHCYKPNMKEKMREVMRYAGPRMMWYHPIAAIRHLIREL